MGSFKTEHRRALSMLLAVLLILSMMAITTLVPNSLFTMSVSAEESNESDETGGEETGGNAGVTVPPPVPNTPTDTDPGTETDPGTTPTQPDTSTVVQETVTAASTTTGTTTSAEVSSAQMDQTVNSAISDATKSGGVPEVVVKVDTPADADTLEVTLPAASLQTLADASGSKLTISSDIATVELNHTALAALADSVAGSTVTLEVAPVAESAMSEAQKAAVQDATVVDLSLVSDGVAIHDFNNGTITVSLAYTLKDDETANDIVVYYMDDNGMLSSCNTRYADGKVTFTTSHFSMYVIGTKALEQTVDFVDVASDAYYYDAVLWAVANNITTGTGDGTTFSPDAGCSRAQFATFLWRASGSPEPSSTDNKFSDVSETEHAAYYDAILWAVEQGITTGTGDGTTFSPSATITRAQAVTLMYRCAQKAGIATETGSASFTDVPNEGNTAVYYDAVVWAVANGITNGNSTTANTFGPSDSCIRAQMITFLYRLFA